MSISEEIVDIAGIYLTKTVHAIEQALQISLFGVDVHLDLLISVGQVKESDELSSALDLFQNRLCHVHQEILQFVRIDEIDNQTLRPEDVLHCLGICRDRTIVTFIILPWARL